MTEPAKERGVVSVFDMQQRMEELLGELAVSKPSLSSKNERIEPPSSARTAELSPELSKDPVNAPELGRVASRTVAISPPVAVSITNAIEPSMVHDVPNTRYRVAEAYSYLTTVVSTVSVNDAALNQFSALVRNANASARGAGEINGSVAAVTGKPGVDATAVDCVAMTTRVAQCLIALRKGATPSAMPVAPQIIDIRTSSLDTLGKDLATYPEHLPFYGRSDMSEQGIAAEASLLVRNAPACYTWRYRNVAPAAAAGPAVAWQRADPRVMPAVVRWAVPGGYDNILAVTENARTFRVPFGGGALTINALVELESHYRRRWGHELMDMGYRTAMALSTVYVTPVADAAVPTGAGFEVRRCSTTVTLGTDAARVPVDLAGPTFNIWDGNGTAQANAGNLRPRSARLSPGRLRLNQRRLWRYWIAQPANAARVPALPRDYTECQQDSTRLYFLYQVVAVGAPGPVEQQDDVEWATVMDFVNVPALIMAEFEAMAESEDNSSMAEIADRLPIEPDAVGEDVTDSTVMYNVFGAKDVALIRLPNLNANTMIGVLAGITRPQVAGGTYPMLDNANLRVRTRTFGMHLHFSFMCSMATAKLSPGLFRTASVEPTLPLSGLTKFLHSGCLPGELSRRAYPANNFWVFENGFNIGGTTKSTNFIGFVVGGNWEVEDGGTVTVLDSNYAALDACVRMTHSIGGTIDVRTPGLQGNLTLIRHASGYINPLSIPHQIPSTRALRPVLLEADAGFSSLLTGSNHDIAITNTY